MPSGSFQYRIVVWILRLGLPLLLLLGGVVFAAHKGSLRLIEPLRWYGDLRVEELSFDLNGNVRIARLVYRPYKVPEDTALTAEGVEIKTPGLFWLVSAGIAGDEKSPAEQRRAWAGRENGGALDPEPRALPQVDRLEVRVNNLVLPTSSWLPPDIRWIGLSTAAPYEALACGAQRRFGAEELAAMGVPNGALHGQLNLESNNEGAKVVIKLGGEGRLHSTWDARLRMKDGSRFFDTDWQSMELVEEQWRVNDEGFVVARNRFCAHRLRLSRPTFVDRHVDAAQQALAALGVGASQDMLEIYRRFSSRGGELTWHSKPQLAMDRARFRALPLEDRVRVMNATLMVNGEQPVAFELGPPAPPPESEEALAAKDTSPAAPDTRKPGSTPPANPSAGTTAASGTTGTTGATTPSPTTAKPPVAPTTGTQSGTTATTTVKPSTTGTTNPANADAGSKPTTTIDPLTGASVPTVPPVSTSTKSADASSGKQVAKTTSTKVSLPPLPATGEVKFEDLGRAIGRTIAVNTSYGTVRTGVVLTYNKAAVTIRTEEHGEEITLILPRATVKRVELVAPG